jgi:P-type Cu+ transporter
MKEALSRPITVGTVAAIAMLTAYLAIISALSGWDFALSQFSEFWPYLVALSVGFAIQIGLYFYLRQLTAKRHYAHCAIATSGTTSGAAMLACCTHYLANILPVIGATALVSAIAEYQIGLFWLGLAFNAAGLAYVLWQVIAAKEAFTERDA